MDQALARFKDDVEQFVWHVETQTVKAKKVMANLAANSLTGKAPILTGAYVKSMRAGINITDESHEPVQPSLRASLVLGNLISEAAKSGIRSEVRRKLKTRIAAAVKIEDEINLSNAIPYSYKVEYTGWKKTSPYHVFGRTVEFLRAMAQRLPEDIGIT